MKPTLRIVIDSARAFYLSQGIKAAEINRVFREAGKLVGDYWQLRFLPKHLEPGARGRYQYERRNYKYNQKKVLRKRWFDNFDERWYDIRKPQPRDWILTGRQKDLLESRYGNLRVTSTAKGSKGQQQLKVRIHVPLAHPIHPVISSAELGEGRGELVRIIKSESREMAAMLMDEVQNRLGKVPGMRQKIIIQ